MLRNTAFSLTDYLKPNQKNSLAHIQGTFPHTAQRGPTLEHALKGIVLPSKTRCNAFMDKVEKKMSPPPVTPM